MGEQEAMSKISKFIDDFSRSLYQNLSKANPKENLIVSPLSAQIALAMALQGAQGETEKELIKGLKLGSEDKTVIQKGFKTLITNLTGGDNLTLNIANKIYTDHTMKIKAEFAKILTEHFRSEVGLVNFTHEPQKSRLEINEWVADKTNQLIKDLLGPTMITSDTRSVLVNAIYFKGKWKFPFVSDQNTKENFHLDENSVVKVDYMNLKKKFQYGEIPDLKARTIELEYAGGEYSLLILLPDKITGLQELQEKLQSKSIADIRSDMRNTEVILKLPKFKIESTLDLNTPLKELGMTSMFENADFSGITDDESLVVSKVIQKAFIDVNEEGTEAAAATAVIMVRCCAVMNPSPPVTFFVTRPFTYVLLNKISNSPLFLGNILKPIYI